MKQKYIRPMAGKAHIGAIIVEQDYKGEYERFALTPDEFKEQFPETYEAFGPINQPNSDTISPLVHIWFAPCEVGDDTWNKFFTDMASGLPESDIAIGNIATVREDFFGVLSPLLLALQPISQ